MDRTLLVSFLFLASNLVSAQCSGTKTITTNSDVNDISSCSTFDGSIVINSTATGDINLSGINSITGNLTAIGATSLASLNAANLTSIGDALYLSALTNLTAIDVTSLQQVDNIFISNTGLTTFTSNNIVNVSSINVDNNADLKLQMTSLEYVNDDLNLQNIGGLDVPALSNITGSFTCKYCSMTTFEATKLFGVDGDIAFISTELRTLEFPVLDGAGSLQLANNSQLTDLSNSFPALRSLLNSLVLHGVFSSVNFPKLLVVGHWADVETTSSNTTICDYFKNLGSNHTIDGSVSCGTSVSQAEAASAITTINSDTPPSSTPTSAGDRSLSYGGSTIALIVAVALFVMT